MAINTDNIQTFTLAEQLSLVNYAISHIMVTGQSYSLRGRQFNKANLGALLEWRTQLQFEVANESATTSGSDGRTALVVFGDRH